jgi:hypothetical protein
MKRMAMESESGDADSLLERLSGPSRKHPALLWLTNAANKSGRTMEIPKAEGSWGGAQKF